MKKSKQKRIGQKRKHSEKEIASREKQKRVKKALFFVAVFSLIVVCFYSTSNIVLATPTIYYEDSKYGDNSNDGLSPSTAWKTIPKANTSILSNENKILFKKGEIWIEKFDRLSFDSVRNSIVNSTNSGGINQIILSSEVVTGWSQYVPDVWQTTLEIWPIHVKSDDTWLAEGFLKDELVNNQWYWESNILYIKDIEGNPDETGKTIIAVVKRGGWSVTSGDFNGDGLSDVVTAPPSEVYIYYGNAEFSNMPDQTLADPDGNPNDGFGFYVASAGDVNDDGFDELIVAMGWGVNKVHLYMGSQHGLSNTPDITLISPDGYPAYGFGHAISLRGGDINGDGFDDILIGSGSQPNYFCVYHGSSSGINSNPDVVVTYPGTDEGSALNLSFVGDINNSGFDDFAVSPRIITPSSVCDVYVYHGSSAGVIKDLPQIITIDSGREHPNGFKVSLSTAGDVNGDGFADLLIGNQWAFGSYINEGKAYIFYGPSSELSDSPDIIINNPNPQYNVRFGNSIDGIGDFNYDGFDDIIVGCPFGNFASIYYGSFGGITNTTSLTLTEVGAFGWSVSHAGDIKGNGQNFIIVGVEFGAAFLYANPEPTTISIDIKPNFCPNPLNVKSKGVLPVAILGTADLDVRDIDIATLGLNGVAPVKSALDDVATPTGFEPCDCLALGRDGTEDLVLKFSTQEILANLPAVQNGDKIPLMLTGELTDGTEIEGIDCVVIMGVK